MSAEPPLKATILVVDDEPRMAALVQFAMEAQGMAVHCAGDAPTAWQILATESIDLVILDIMLPGESGLEMCRRLPGTGTGPSKESPWRAPH